jgi:citrate lyase subunit beta / citryl-CoA lyase
MVSLAAAPVVPLLVPGSRPDSFERAATLGADAVILDFEDSVAPEAKTEARASVAEHASCLQDCAVVIRVNGRQTPWFEDDVEAIRSLPIAAVMLPKTECAKDVREVTRRVQRNLPIISLIESAAASASCRTFCQRPASFASPSARSTSRSTSTVRIRRLPS